jgi:FtsP/CotA-like multicopper oxidase with cupredoxin domain
VLVNGVIQPALKVRRRYRFRLLNSDNARNMSFRLSNGTEFTQIGADGAYSPDLFGAPRSP